MNTDDYVYFQIGGSLGIIPAIVTFFGSWWYCVDAYGYLFGFGLGWIPSALLAAIVLLVFAILWGPMILGALYLAYRNWL